jgi:hypothetical protein
MRWWKIILIFFLVKLLVLALVVFVLARKPVPETITYGMSFNVMYANELSLDWRETYDAIVDDLGVRHLRLAAHWPMIEPAAGEYNFEEMDYQIKKAGGGRCRGFVGGRPQTPALARVPCSRVG